MTRAERFQFGLIAARGLPWLAGGALLIYAGLTCLCMSGQFCLYAYAYRCNSHYKIA